MPRSLPLPRVRSSFRWRLVRGRVYSRTWQQTQTTSHKPPSTRDPNSVSAANDLYPVKTFLCEVNMLNCLIYVRKILSLTWSCIIPFSDIFASKRKDKLRPRFSPDSCGLGGALSWRVVAEDCSSKTEVEAFIGISPDSVIVVQDNCHHDTLFLTASKSIIGWSALPNSIRIYFHMVREHSLLVLVND